MLEIFNHDTNSKHILIVGYTVYFLFLTCPKSFAPSIVWRTRRDSKTLQNGECPYSLKMSLYSIHLPYKDALDAAHMPNDHYQWILFSPKGIH